MNRSARSLPLPLAFALCLAVGSAALPARLGAQATPSDAFLSGFVLSGDWAMDIDAKPADQGEIYFSDRARSLLLIDPSFPSPVLVNIPAHSVEALDLMKVAKQADGSIDLLADAVLAPQGSFDVAGDGQKMTVSFKVAGEAVVLKPKPWLLGPQTGDALLAYNPEYKRRANEYLPDDSTMKKLRAEKGKIRVLTFFGSWCPHCKKHVPMLLKVMQGLKGSAIQFDFYGLPAPLTDDPQSTKFDVQGVPTGIVYIDGKEVGRIPASEWSNPELGLASVLANAKADKGKGSAGQGGSRK